jgi:hypothetical protein
MKPQYIDQRAINAALIRANNEIKDLEKRRDIATKICGAAPESVDGGIEVYEYLTLADYPHASKYVAAEMRGVASLFNEYEQLRKRGAGAIGDRYEVVNGKIVVSEKYKAEVHEQHSVTLEGAEALYFSKLSDIVARITELNDLMPSPIAHKYIQIDGRGNASIKTLELIAALQGSNRSRI